jgi:hypothetical protein
MEWVISVRCAAAISSIGGGAFDFVAAYLVCEDAWYIIPAKETRGKWSISLRTKCDHSRYEKYLEAWDLLREPEFDGDIQACAEEFPGEVFLSSFPALSTGITCPAQFVHNQA